MFVQSALTRAVVVETKQMVVVLAVTEVNEDVVVQYLSWKMFGFERKNLNVLIYLNKREQSTYNTAVTGGHSNQ